MAEEIEFILETAGAYLEKIPTRKDILSMFAGIRPLVKTADVKSTVALSRDHDWKQEQTEIFRKLSNSYLPG